MQGKRQDLTPRPVRYLHKDHLGSITVITDESGNEVESFSFDPWGKRRAPTLAQLQSILGTWSALTNYQKGNLTIPALTLTSATTHKGFTGHNQLDGVNLIHMGGRVYDAEIGRFLSADPFVQDSTNLQGLNRYSYVENNPLSYTDPSGYFLKSLFKKIGKAIKNAVSAVIEFERELRRKILRAIGKVEGLSTIISVALNFIPGCQGWCSMAFSAAMTDANGGTIGQMLTGMAIAMIVPDVGGMIGNSLQNVIGEFAANAAGSMIQGGIIAKAQGGKFADGVKGAAISFGVMRIMGAGGEPAGTNGKGQSDNSTATTTRSANSGALNMALDVVGKIWNLPNTIVGLAYGGVGHVVGLLMGTNPSISFGNNAIQFHNNPLMPSAMTLGNVIIYGPKSGPGKANIPFMNSPAGHTVGREEFRHTQQGQILGPLYFPAHMLGGISSFFRSPHPDLRSPVDRWHSNNFMESGPMKDEVF